MPNGTLNLTREWLVMIAVGLVAAVLGWHGLWPLSLVATAIGAVLFLVLLAHEIDPARRRARSADRSSPDNALQATDNR
jgi:Flp pilus assembly protein TadB